MKYHKEVKRPIDLTGSVEAVIAELSSAAEGIVEPEVADISWYGGRPEYAVVGWRPMTDKEREKADKASARAKEAAARKREAKKEAERREYERLKKKYEEWREF